MLTDVDQLWVADITYIRLREEFVHLAFVLAAFSRRVIGGALNRTLEDKLTLTALPMALSQRNVQPGLIHHSDRGSQGGFNRYFPKGTDLNLHTADELNAVAHAINTRPRKTLS